MKDIMDENRVKKSKRKRRPDDSALKNFTARVSSRSFAGNYGDWRLRGEVNRYAWETLHLVGQDDQVKSVMQQRIQAALATEWAIKSDDEKAIDMLKDNLIAIGFEDNFRQMLKNALEYGYSVAEIMWAPDGNNYLIDSIKVRHPSNFTFEETSGALRFQGEIMPPNKFWVYRHNADNANDYYGNGLLYDLYWPVHFKTYGVKEWAKYLNFVGLPPLVGKYGAERSKKEDIEDMLDMLERAKANGVLAIPEDCSVELLQTHAGSTLDYKEFVSVMNMAISKTVLSQTMTTDEGSSLSQSKTHMDVREELVKSDVDMLSDSFTKQVLAPYTYWNGLADIEFSRKFDDTEASRDAEMKAVEVIEKMDRAGYEPEDTWLDERVPGFKKKEVQAMPMKPPHNMPPQNPKEPGNNPEFAENNPDLADQITEQLADFTDKPVADMVDKVKEVIDNAENMEDAMVGLLRIYNIMDGNDIANQIGGALLAAEMNGRADRNDNNG